MKTSLTFCICAYNAERYIRETLESLFNQTSRVFDLWVVDDASTDQTRTICEKFFIEHQWSCAKVITLPENGGLAAGRRYAEMHIKTEYIGFIDADDVMLPHAVERMMDVIEADENCMSISGYCSYISPTGNDIHGGIFIGATSKEVFFEQAAKEKLMFRPPMNISRVSWIRRAGCRAVEGFPDGKPRYQDMCEDLDLWTRMSDFFKEGKYMLVLPEVLFKYRKIPSSMSANGIAMNMRMRHIKCNLKRRRRGEAEYTFIDYLSSLTPWQRMKYAYSDWSQGFYKQAGFHYMKKNYLRFLLNFGCAALFNPSYFLQKMKHNVKR